MAPAIPNAVEALDQQKDKVASAKISIIEVQKVASKHKDPEVVIDLSTPPVLLDHAAELPPSGILTEQGEYQPSYTTDPETSEIAYIAEDEVAAWDDTELADILLGITPQPQNTGDGKMVSFAAEAKDETSPISDLNTQEILAAFQELAADDKQEVAQVVEDITIKLQEIVELRLGDSDEALVAEVELQVLVVTLLEKMHLEPTDDRVWTLLQACTESLSEQPDELLTAEAGEVIDEGTHESKHGLTYLLRQLAKLAKRQEVPQLQLWLARFACHQLAPALAFVQP